MSALYSYGLLALAQLLFFRLLRLVKYQSAASHRSLAHADYLIAAAGSGLLVALSALHLTAALLAVCAGTALFFILWLDAALYRIFTVELGASGIGDVVLSNLVAEMRKMRAAQRFFQENRLFTLLPIAALVAHLATLLPQVLLRGGAEVLLVAYLIWSLGAGSPGRAAAPSSASTARRALVHESLQRGELVEPFGPEGRITSPFGYRLLRWPTGRGSPECLAFEQWVLQQAAATRAAIAA